MEVAYITLEEFEKKYAELGFDEHDLEACKNPHKGFRTVIKETPSYIFTKLSFIVNPMDTENLANVFIGIKRDAVYFIEHNDIDGAIREVFDQAVERCPTENVSVERMIAAFFRVAVYEDGELAEMAYKGVADLEDQILKEEVSDHFNEDLHSIKTYLLSVKNYYEQMADLLEVIEDNAYGIFNPDNLNKITYTLRKINGFKTDISAMVDLLSQLQNSYASYLDTKMNGTMKLLTIITTIFMPLTLIVGWYGMNFSTMPEITWEFGYRYVILLSIILSTAVIIIAKVKKWF